MSSRERFVLSHRPLLRVIRDLLPNKQIRPRLCTQASTVVTRGGKNGVNTSAYHTHPAEHGAPFFFAANGERTGQSRARPRTRFRKQADNMVKSGKRNSAAAAAFPVMVVPSKTDHQLKSLLDYGDNLEVCEIVNVTPPFRSTCEALLLRYLAILYSSNSACTRVLSESATLDHHCC